jgi:N6-adenosine-specific RNA methylase IME4
MYDVIEIDPPWKFNKRKKVRLDGTFSKFGVGASRYDLLSYDKLKSIDINFLLNSPGILLIWTTEYHLSQAMSLINEWGLEYKNIAFIWHKINTRAKSLRKNYAYYTNINIELCLLATKGKSFKIIDNSIFEILNQDAVLNFGNLEMGDFSMSFKHEMTQHSMKPNIHPLINRLIGEKKCLEIFARKLNKKKSEWEATGLEYDGVDIFDFIKNKKENKY